MIGRANRHWGRSLLLAVTLIAVAMQALKLGSRGVLLHRWPTGGQWGQLALVAWLLISLWERKAWARVAAAVYFSLAAVAGGGFLFFVAWWRIEPPLRIVSLLIVALAGLAAAILWSSTSLRSYMTDRSTAGNDAGGSTSAG